MLRADPFTSKLLKLSESSFLRSLVPEHVAMIENLKSLRLPSFLKEILIQKDFVESNSRGFWPED